MIKTALLAAAATFMCAGPAAAHGYVGIDYKSADNFDESTVWELEGAVGFGGPTGWGFQIDGSVANGEYDTAGADVESHNLTGHAFYTSSTGWRLGGVVGVSNAEVGATEFEDTTFGVEGTYDIGTQAVLNGSVTFGEFDIVGVSLDTWNFDAGVDFYATPNFRIGGSFGVGTIETSGFEGDTTSFSIDAEWQPWTTPVSFTLGYSTFEDDDLLAGIDPDALHVGVRWNFGGGTLRDRDNATPFDTRTAYTQRFFDIR